MEKVKSTSNQTFGAILKLSEKEARALKAITEYGTKTFLDCFYEHLGRNPLKPHEEGLISLFQTIKDELPKHLNKFDKARAVFNENN